MALRIYAEALGGAIKPELDGRSPTRSRYSSSANSYNLAYTIFGGTAPLLGIYLVEQSGSKIAPAIYMAIVSVAVFAIVLMMPETFRKSLFHAEDVQLRSAAGIDSFKLRAVDVCPKSAATIASPGRESLTGLVNQSGVLEVGLALAQKGADPFCEFATSERHRLRHRLGGKKIINRTIGTVQQHLGQAERSSWPCRQFLR